MQAISIAINGIIAVMSVVAWLQLVLDARESQKLAARGWRSLKYFTVLSNLFSGGVSLTYVFYAIIFAGQVPMWLFILKLEAAAAVMLTFLTVVLLLGPYYGFKPMYEGGNLWMHAVLPLLALLDCWLFVPVAQLPFWTTLCAMIPLVFYGIWYLARIVRHNVQPGDMTYDFYGFLRWGRDKVPAVMVGMLVFSWVISLLIRLGSRLFGLA